MPAKKKRRPTYEEIKRQLIFSEQRIVRILRQNEELSRTNLALSIQVSELTQTIEDMNMSNVFRGWNNKIQKGRGIN